MPREDAAEREAIRAMYKKRGFTNVTIRYHTAIAMYGISFNGNVGPFGLETVWLSKYTAKKLLAKSTDLQNLLEPVNYSKKRRTRI